MKGSARIIALCGICGAIASVSLLVVGWLPYVALIFGVFASIATVTPMLVDGKNIKWSMLVYAVTVTVGALSGFFIGNPVAVAPVLFFCVPFCIIKVYAESPRTTLDTNETARDADEHWSEPHLVNNEKPKMRLPVWLKWLLYYILLEAGLALTFVVTWWLTPGVFEQLYSNKTVFWLVVCAAQVAVPMYDLLLRGCLIAATKVVRKVYH